MNCYNAMGRATITILSSNGTTFAGYADEYLIQYSHQDVTGPLVDCSNLLVQKFVQKMTSRLKWRDGIPRLYVWHVLRWRMENPIPPVVSFQRMIILIGITIWTLSRVVPLRVMLLSVSSLLVPLSSCICFEIADSLIMQQYLARIIQYNNQPVSGV
eukprot:scaffold8949_cov75-Cyclotella_meneghiniana.AAC.9